MNTPNDNTAYYVIGFFALMVILFAGVLFKELKRSEPSSNFEMVPSRVYPGQGNGDQYVTVLKDRNTGHWCYLLINKEGDRHVVQIMDCE